jgi:HEAT repeat protein
MPDEKALPALIEALKDEDASVRYLCTMALGWIKSRDALDPVLKLLKDPDKNVRGAAAQALGKIGEKKAVKPLIKILGDKDLTVRCHAALALGAIGDRKACIPLINLLQKDQPHGIIWAFTMALGDIGDKIAAPVIKKSREMKPKGPEHGHFDSREISAVKQINQAGACALFKITGDEKELNFLIGQTAGGRAKIDRTDWELRRWAVMLLGTIHDKRVIDPIIDKLKDNKIPVKEEAYGALCALTKQDFGLDHARWKEWWQKNRDAFKFEGK